MSSFSTSEEAASVRTSPPDYGASLPAKPVVTIGPSKSWVALQLGDFWQYRELLYFLTWRDVKVRYKQTLLGAAWAILQPLLTMLIFTIVTVMGAIVLSFSVVTCSPSLPLHAQRQVD